ncbi:CDP-diacylglycerol--serine O-phosphatidyltransferase [Thorsellia kenyensis]|uniref:CDP-diacylglycerol--serine O-phosphatidyltransferase n=1 Tax=Thorsellia kenyensis TaxID=1549888 RepID=A0ABV6CAA7_9GAMM
MFSNNSQDESYQFISKLPKITIDKSSINFLGDPKRYKEFLLNEIQNAKVRIAIVALYFENDEAGNEIFTALYSAKQKNPALDIVICVDWHRAQRGRIGINNLNKTNADWYLELTEKHTPNEIPVYGIPINTRETLGVLHFKGAIIDDTTLFTGASINNVYLHQEEKYRLDRYHAIYNKPLANSFYQFIFEKMINSKAAQRLDSAQRPKTSSIKKYIKQLRRDLSQSHLTVIEDHSHHVKLDFPVEATPIVGVGAKNTFNQLIESLVAISKKKIIICTPYFNLPPALLKKMRKKLKEGIEIEIIVGDKTANDFYIPVTEPFKAIGSLPYFYELNLKKFMKKYQKFCDKGLLHIHLWKDNDHTFHLKGLWIDDNWMLLTGNNLNPRAWSLDLENGILLHDENQYLAVSKAAELEYIHQHTNRLEHFSHLDEIDDYPYKVKKFIRRLKRVKMDKLINRLL